MEGASTFEKKAISGICQKYKYGVGVFKNAFPVFPRRKAVGTKRHAQGL
jgi:hypothetical protein